MRIGSSAATMSAVDLWMFMSLPFSFLSSVYCLYLTVPTQVRMAAQRARGGAKRRARANDFCVSFEVSCYKGLLSLPRDSPVPITQCITCMGVA